jgi:hypothetical protein
MENHLEHREIETRSTTTIEFCGTPFGARFKFFVHNAIEDMVSERMGKKIRGQEGISHFYWPLNVSEMTEERYLEQVDGVRKLLRRRHRSHNVSLVQDGVFAAMTLTEIFRRARIFSEEEAENHIRGLFPYAKMEDLILLTLVQPRAALTRELFFPDENSIKRKFIFFTVYNEAAERVLNQYRDQLPPVEVIKPKGDRFPRDEVFFANANLALQFLGLPTIEEWSEILEADAQKKAEGRRVSGEAGGTTIAGLTTEEMRSYLAANDWSQSEWQKKRLNEIISRIIDILEEERFVSPRDH